MEMTKLSMEKWKSNKGQEEIHYFLEGTQTYVWGINKKLLGPRLHDIIKILIEQDMNINGGN